MATARDLAIDPINSDLQVTGQDLAPLLTDRAAILSDLNATMQMALGEWFLDQSQGIPYFSKTPGDLGIFGQKKVNLQGLRGVIVDALAARLGVIQVLSVVLTQNSTRRSLSITWTVLTDVGQLSSTTKVSP